MAQKNNTSILIVALLITLSILGGGIWWLSRYFGVKVPEIAHKSVTGSLKERLSTGERVLVAGTHSDLLKQQAASAIAQGNYADAIAVLSSYLQQYRNDPEALIYLNNAKIGSNQAYTIAIVVPTATNVDGANEILRGVAQAQQDVNAQGGINGVPLKVAIANDDNDPAIAQQIAKTLADDPEVLGVVGHWASDVTLATAPIYQSQQLVAISPVSTSIQLSGVGNYIFRTVPNDRFAGSTLSRYVINRLNKRRATIIYNAQSNYSKSLKDEFKTAFYADGGEIIAEVDQSQPNFNAATAFQQAIAKGSDTLMLAATTSNLNQVLQLLQVNKGKLPIVAGDDVYSPQILQIAGEDAVGLVVAIPWHILAHGNTPFVRKSRQLWGAEVNWRTVTAYDAAIALITAIRKSPTRQDIQATLINPSFTASGATDAVRFLPSGDRNQAVQLVTVVAGKRTGYGYDFIPIR